MHLFVILGAIVALSFSISYVIATLKGKVKPNKVTWLIWAIAPLISAAAAVSSGVSWAVLPVFMSGFGPALVFIASFLNKDAYWRIERFDYICGGISILALIAWYLTKDPNVAIILAILSDILAGLPTFSITTITGDSTKGYSVTGVATPNSSVTLTVGGVQYTGTADNSGNFLISLPGTVGPKATVVAVATVSGFLSNTATGITPSDPTPAPPVKPTPKSTPTTPKTTPTPASATPTAKTTATPVSKTTPTPKPVSVSTKQHPTLPKTGDDSVKSSSISIVGVVLIGIGALWLSMKRKQKSNG